MDKSSYFKQLPSIEYIKNNKYLLENIPETPDWLIVKVSQDILNNLRHVINNSSLEELDKLDWSKNAIIDKIIVKINSIFSTSLNKVINATGVVIHTNLGRSLINKTVAQKMYDIATNYTDLEMNLTTGKRSQRGEEAVDILKILTGCEDAVIVNNNAAAVLLILSTFAKEKEVIVSRGEQVEVGGSFRIPDVMKSSGAKLVEVGTTNRTNIDDYEAAITDNTGLLMKIHSSNFKILGFTKEPTLEEMVALSNKYNIPLVHDLGSGSFIDFTDFSLPFEPLVQTSMKENVDILCFSGDKLLGASQAGIILGKKQYIEKIRKNQLLRALRVDKITLAILTETLKLYINPEKALKEIPTLKMLTMPLADITNRVEKLYSLMSKLKIDADYKIIDEYSSCGGGAMPTSILSTKVIALKSCKISTGDLALKLRLAENPVVCRVHEDNIFLDVRTIQEDDFSILAENLKNICGVKL